MAANNLRILKGGRTVQRVRTESSGVSGVAGMREGDGILAAAAPGTGTNYAGLALDGDPVQGTDIFMGVSKSASTSTSTADGVIDVEIATPGTVMEMLATTVSNVNTDAKLLGLLFDHRSFDRTADTAVGVLTLDEATATGASTLAFLVLDGRIADGMMYFTPANAWIGRGLV